MLTGLRYLFVDMNSYFASVEQQLRPELRGRPVAVVPMMADTTCCLAASYEAKAFGVRTGTSVREAREMCPGIRFVEARTEEYIYHHHRIIAAVESCLPVTAVLSIDEMVCRLWGNDRQPEQAEQLAHQIKEAVRTQAGEFMKCSIGVGPNRLLAKTAADMQKPNGLTFIGQNELPHRLHSLKLMDFCGIGQQTRQRLERSGIFTVEQLCQASEDHLSRVWGSQILGSAWWRKLRGEDVSEPPTHRRTVGHSHVLPPDLRHPEAARGILVRLIHKAGARLRQLHHWAKRIDVQITYLGNQSWHDSLKFPPTQDTLTFIQAGHELWKRRPPGRLLKIGMVLNDLVPARNAAFSLYEEDRQRQDLSVVMDDVNRRFGGNSVYFGGMHHLQDQAPTRIAFTNIPDLSVPG